MSPVDGIDRPWAARKADAGLLAADRPPLATNLLDDIKMQIAGETDDVPHHLIGDHIGEEAAHVGQHAGMGHEFGKDVVFEADRRRLHPAQPRRGGQQRRRDLAEVGVGVRHLTQGLRFVSGVDD